MRNIAIINIHSKTDIFENIIKHLDSGDKIYIFHIMDIDTTVNDNVEYIRIPHEYTDSESKIKNYVTKFFFDHGFSGFLHVIEDKVEILKNPVVFMGEIEEMMSVLEIKSWFNTETDGCNYTFNIFNPRISVEIDDPSVMGVYDKTIYWTSHSNTSWVCYDYNGSSYDEFKFDESFRIPMYFIIKFLAERRKNKKEDEMYYMNFYPTIQSERGVFKTISNGEFITFTKDDHNNEYNIFMSQSINHNSDSTVEPIMDTMYRKLLKLKQK